MYFVVDTLGLMNKPVIFISDLHLDPSQPDITERFTQFVERYGMNAAAVYILGDFFEVWIGDDDRQPFIQEIKTLLRKLTEHGVPVYLMHGNRDFLIGKRFCAQTGCQLLMDPTIIELYGKRVLLMHGDTLCTRDVKYLKFRKKVRNKWIQRLYLALPLRLRQTIAQKMREGSNQHVDNIDAATMDVDYRYVEELIDQYEADLMIHGHTHRPQIVQHPNKKKKQRRYVLGAWHQDGWMIEASQLGFRLMKLNLYARNVTKIRRISAVYVW